MTHPRRLGEITPGIVDKAAAERQRLDDLARSHDGRIPAGMVRTPPTLEQRIQRLDDLIETGEARAAVHEGNVEKWLVKGQPQAARRNREDAKLIRDTLELYRATLREIAPAEADSAEDAA